MKSQSPLILPGDDEFRPGVPKPESDYEALARLGARLGLPVPQVFLSIEVENPGEGRRVVEARRSRTFTRNYWNVHFLMLSNSPLINTGTFGAGVLRPKDIVGTTQNVRGDIANSFQPDPFAAMASIGAIGTLNGIVAGTGTAAESFEDSTLGAVINHGTSAGTFSYQAQNTTNAPTYNAGTKTWSRTTSRIMNNNSGGAIVVGEVGWYSIHMTWGGAARNTTATFLTNRDLLGATVNVANAGQFTVTYTVTLTFPA